MLAYAAVSFPETTANSIYTVLEFIRSHPTASSIGIIVAAGALLGPDLLAGSAVAGALSMARADCVGHTSSSILGAGVQLRGLGWLTQQWQVALLGPHLKIQSQSHLQCTCSCRNWPSKAEQPTRKPEAHGAKATIHSQLQSLQYDVSSWLLLLLPTPGVLVLLAVKLGILQMPQMPQLPKVPGQALLSRQLNNAGKALQDRLHDLDDGLDDLGDSVRVDRAATQSNFNTGVSSSSNSLLSSGSRESRLLDVQAAPAPPTAAAAAETSPSILSQQQQQQQQGLAVPGLAGVEGLAQQLGSTARNLGTSAFEQAKAAGSAALQQSKQLKDSGAVQDLTQQTAEVAGKAAQATKQAVGSLWQHGQQVAGAEVLGGLKQGTSAAVERASEAAKGLRVSPPWVGRTSGLGAGEFSSSSGSGIGWTAAAQQQRQAAEQASAMPGDVGGAGINSGKTQQEIDAILANS
jgi:hypothetical protein